LAGPELAGQTFDLPRGRTLIGRSKVADVVLPGRVISRLHGAVVWDHVAGGYVLVDLGAHNATLVNGDRVRGSRPLSGGDRIRILDYVLAFEAVPAGSG
jgi:pSer/pThr/pTyr-binding forkhead associated (FHA) protein